MTDSIPFYTLGPEGTWADAAASALSTEYAQELRDPIENVRLDGWEEILQETDETQGSFGIFAVENNAEKQVGAGKQLLIDEIVDNGCELQIIDEYIQPLRQDLIYGGHDISQVEKVLSHPAALNQCREALESFEYSQGESVDLWQRKEEFNSTAAAVEKAAEDPGIAAIGSEHAAECYGAEVYQRDLQDSDLNATRFLVLGDEPVRDHEYWKTSMVVTPEGHDEAGQLLKISEIMAGVNDGASRDPINMSDFEARDTGKLLGDYRFWIDAQVHVEEERFQEASGELDSAGYNTEVIGCYPDALRSYREGQQ